MQLRLADMVKKASGPGWRRIAAPPPVIGSYPVSHRQGVLFDWPRVLGAVRERGFAPPPDPGLVAFLEEHVADHVRALGWSVSLAQRTRQALRILLGCQDTPGAPLRATEVELLHTIGLPTTQVLVVLAAAGMLEEDRPVVGLGPWLDRLVDGLPEAMVAELEVCAEILLTGSKTPPRMRARSRKRAQQVIRLSLPAIRTWAEEGHDSLREISRADVLAVLPASGSQRIAGLSALRGVFRILKARKLAFTNPTARIPGAGYLSNIPMPVDLGAVRDVLSSTDPTVAVLAAIVAFHAIPPRQLRAIRLTDVRDGRLYIDGRVVVLAEPVRDRLRAYLDYRSRRWPRTANPHLWLHHRNAVSTAPVAADWITQRLGGLALAMRVDRILDELISTRGDVRRTLDLFGLSTAGASRYLRALSHPELEADQGGAGSGRPTTL